MRGETDGFITGATLDITGATLDITGATSMA